MKAYVISLKRSTDRRVTAGQLLQAAGIAYEFFDGIEGRLGYEPFFERYDERQYLINCGRPARLGEIGCYASHKALWQKCIDLNTPIMIMEDDFALHSEFGAAVEASKALIHRYKFIRLQVERRARKRPVLSQGGFTLHYYTKAPHSMMCYVIHPDAARLLLAKACVLDAPVDVMLKKNWEHQLGLYGLTPYTVMDNEQGFATTIVGRIKHKKSLDVAFARLMTKVSWRWKSMLFNLTYPGPDALPAYAASRGNQLVAVNVAERMVLVSFLVLVGAVLS
jgi:glycosyl transferase, family 25